MNTPLSQTKVQHVEALAATPAGPRLLTATELLQVSGGAALGNNGSLQPVVTLSFTGPDDGDAPRGGW